MRDEGGYEVSSSTATSDRGCACGTVQNRAPPNTVDSQGDFLSLPCEVSKGTDKTRTPTSTSDRGCVPLTVGTGTTYELKAPTDVAERVCQTVSDTESRAQRHSLRHERCDFSARDDLPPGGCTLWQTRRAEPVRYVGTRGGHGRYQS